MTLPKRKGYVITVSNTLLENDCPVSKKEAERVINSTADNIAKSR